MQYERCLATTPVRSLKRSIFVFMPGAAIRTSTVCPARNCVRFLFLPFSAFALSTFIVLLRLRLIVSDLNGQRLPEHAHRDGRADRQACAR